jgi:hypothetical protein
MNFFPKKIKYEPISVKSFFQSHLKPEPLCVWQFRNKIKGVPTNVKRYFQRPECFLEVPLAVIITGWGVAVCIDEEIRRMTFWEVFISTHLAFYINLPRLVPKTIEDLILKGYTPAYMVFLLVVLYINTHEVRSYDHDHTPSTPASNLSYTGISKNI